jgi:hypothetical protein
MQRSRRSSPRWAGSRTGCQGQTAARLQLGGDERGEQTQGTEGMTTRRRSRITHRHRPRDTNGRGTFGGYLLAPWRREREREGGGGAHTHAGAHKSRDRYPTDRDIRGREPNIVHPPTSPELRDGPAPVRHRAVQRREPMAAPARSRKGATQTSTATHSL